MPPPQAAPPSPKLEMEWDDDEMATAIYDKPGMEYPGPGAPAPIIAAGAVWLL